MLVSEKRITGFTIVELLIVIVVIAILAAISVVAYSGVQQRARDAIRLTNLRTIQKALAQYHAVNGEYPPAATSGFELSTRPSGSFLVPLKNAGFLPDPPVDPVNDGVHFYAYYLYDAGAYGCDASRGDFYVLYENRFETTGGKHPNSPGFSCPERNWQTSNPLTTQWVTGGYEN